MIKKVLFIGALLVPGLAYGANPSAPLSVEVVPAGSAPAIPAAAQAAGFTTLAANYDFSTPFYATQSNWLECNRASSATNQWYLGNGGFTPPPPVCDVTQVFDSVADTNVMRFRWQPEYFASTPVGNHGMYISTMHADAIRVTAYPFLYMEYTARVSVAVNKSYVSMWTNSQYAQQNGNNLIEYDNIETFGICDFCAHPGFFQWDKVGHPQTSVWTGFPPGFDTTAYHKYAMRIARTGSVIQVCSYVDDALATFNGSTGCVNVPSPTTVELVQRNALIFGTGTCCGEGEVNNTAVQVDLLVKSIRVWSCASWQTALCSN
jgi:hypothetical protein